MADLCAESWDRLIKLHLRYDELGDGAVAALAPVAPQLAELSLYGNQITDDGALELVGLIRTDRLVRLDLGRNPISAPVQEAIRDRLGDKVVF